MSEASVKATFEVEKDTTAPGRLDVTVDLGSQGNVTTDGHPVELGRGRSRSGAAGRPGPELVFPIQLSPSRRRPRRAPMRPDPPGYVGRKAADLQCGGESHLPSPPGDPRSTTPRRPSGPASPTSPRRAGGRPRSPTGCATRRCPGDDPTAPAAPARRTRRSIASSAASERAEEIVGAPQPGAGPRRHDDRRPAADPRRRRVGQDARPRPPDRVPRRRQGRRGRGRSSPSRSPTGPRPSCASGSSALVGEGGRDVQAGTFHALCARVLRRDGEAIGIDRRFVIYDTDDQQALMKQILREEDLPLTGEFRPSGVLGAISRAKNEMLDPTFLAENAVEPPRADDRPARDALPGAPAQGRTRSTSTTCCSRPSGCSSEAPDVLAQLPGALALPPRRRVPGHEPRRSTCGSARSPRKHRNLCGRRRRRPVDLLVARRGPAQHPRLRARLARTRRSSSSSRTTARRS